jgi:hypothetical protein
MQKEGLSDYTFVVTLSDLYLAKGGRTIIQKYMQEAVNARGIE